MMKNAATYATNDSGWLRLARAVESSDDVSSSEPATVSGAYSLATPTHDGFTSVRIGWNAGRMQATTVLRGIRPLTEDEQSRLSRLDDEEASDYLDRLVAAELERGAR